MSKFFWSACLGNLSEHYDTALFGLLAPFLSPLIFPEQDPVTALILTYAMIPLGMLARPFGSLLFGYIGDTYGRERALFITLACMGIISLGMSITPLYPQVGVIAPLIFCLGRILQNFFAAGEIAGGAIFLLEKSQEKQRDLVSSLYSTSTLGGILLASAGVALLSGFGLVYSGWRFLYLFGCVTALFGCIIRKQEGAIRTLPSLTRIPLIQQLYVYRKYVLFIAIVSGFSYANYSIALVLMNGFVPLVSTLTKEEMLHLNTILLILDFCALPLFGFLSSKIAREKMMLGSALLVVLGGLPAFLLLSQATLSIVICVRIYLVLVGVAFCAPFHAWAQQLVPPQCRYLVISFGYAIGSQLLGGPTAAFSLWCFQKTGSIASVAGYWIFLGVLSSGALILAMEGIAKLHSEPKTPF